MKLSEYGVHTNKSDIQPLPATTSNSIQSGWQLVRQTDTENPLYYVSIIHTSLASGHRHTQSKNQCIRRINQEWRFRASGTQ